MHFSAIRSILDVSSQLFDSQLERGARHSPARPRFQYLDTGARGDEVRPRRSSERADSRERRRGPASRDTHGTVTFVCDNTTKTRDVHLTLTSNGNTADVTFTFEVSPSGCP